MLLLIVFLLSAHVLGTNRDLSVERLVDEGFHVMDEVLARDSRGFERVVSQFQGHEGPGVDVVPSWLFGGAVGTTQEIHLGALIESPFYGYEIKERPGWIIGYYPVHEGHIHMDKFAMNELLGRCRHIQAHNVVYFSRPNPGTYKSWMYTIIDDGPRRLAVGDTSIPTAGWIKSGALSLRAKCRLIETVTDLSFLRLRHPHISIDPRLCLIHSLSHINPRPDDRDIFMDTSIMPVCSYFVHAHPGVSLRDTLSQIGHLIHSNARGTNFLRFGFYTDEFIRRAFFLDSEYPEPLRNAEGQVYHFWSLEGVAGDDFQDYTRAQIRLEFQEFVDLFTQAWRMAESDPTSIPPRVESIADLIDQIAPFVIL
jgi:hypothetical protein